MLAPSPPAGFCPPFDLALADRLAFPSLGGGGMGPGTRCSVTMSPRKLIDRSWGDRGLGSMCVRIVDVAVTMIAILGQ